MMLPVLVVEDRRRIAEQIVGLFKHIVGENDIIVETAPSVTQAKALIFTHSFSLVVVGGALPEENGGRPESGAGLAFLDHLRETGFRGPAVFYSSCTQDVSCAATKSIAGMSVSSYIKTQAPNKLPPWNNQNAVYATPSELVFICCRLLKWSPCRKEDRGRQ